VGAFISYRQVYSPALGREQFIQTQMCFVSRSHPGTHHEDALARFHRNFD